MSLQIIDENDEYIIVYKPAGLATQTARLGEKDLVSDLKNYLFAQGMRSEISIINRLDQPVEGLVLVAKTKSAAASLSEQLRDGKLDKYYRATVFGHMRHEKGRLQDYLLKNSKTNLSVVSTADNRLAKKAILEYEVVSQEEETDTVDIHLITGRHHQIRVQFAHEGCPLLGDRKYGNEKSISYSDEVGARFVALKAYKLSFIEPHTGDRVTFVAPNLG